MQEKNVRLVDEKIIIIVNNKLWSFILYLGDSGKNYEDTHNFRLSLDRRRKSNLKLLNYATI